MKFSYELKIKAGNTKFLAKLEYVRKAKATAQLKFNDSKEDVIWSAGPYEKWPGEKCPRPQALPCQGLHIGWGVYPKTQAIAVIWGIT